MRLDQSAKWQQFPDDYTGDLDQFGPGGEPPQPPRRPWYHPLRWGWRRILLGIVALFMLIIRSRRRA